MMPGVLSYRLDQDGDVRAQREYDARMGEVAAATAHLTAAVHSRMRGLVGWVRRSRPRAVRPPRHEPAGGHR
jgi:hypothetical protein